MIRLCLVILCMTISQAMDDQTSTLKILKQRPKSMTAEICIHHNYTINCGWEMRIDFSGPLLYFSMNGADIKTRVELFKSKTQPFVIVGNNGKNKVQASGTCHRFQANFVLPVNVTGAYSRICTEGQGTYLVKGNNSDGVERTQSRSGELRSRKGQPGTDSNESATDEKAPKPCKYTTCNRGQLSVTSISSWRLGIHGQICVSYDFPVTCIYDIGLAFSRRIKSLWVVGMHISDESELDHEFLYKLTLQRHTAVRLNMTECYPFVAHHAPRTEQTNITGQYLDECHVLDIAAPSTTTASTRKSTTKTPRVRKNNATERISTDIVDSNSTFFVTYTASWKTLRAGKIYVHPKNPLTCGNLVELAFSPPVLSFESRMMTILAENHTKDESVFQLKSRIPRFYKNRNYFKFIVRHISRDVLTNVTGVNISECNDTATEMTTDTDFTTATTPETTTATYTRVFDYAEALNLSMTFYLNQRAGNVNDSQKGRRQNSCMQILRDGQDLSGGWYDSADYAKFTFPLAGTTTTLLWGFLQWKEAYSTAGKLEEMYELVKHPLDFLISCWNNDKQIVYTQVGGRKESVTWKDLEQAESDRQIQFKDASNGASDLAGEMAAAFAAGSIVFKEKDPVYAAELLERAKQVFDFADKHRGLYSTNNAQAELHYKSLFYADELCWGAAWLLRATDDEKYLSNIEAAEAMFTSDASSVFSWYAKNVGCYMLMHNYRNTTEQDRQRYRLNIENFLTNWINSTLTTNCGLAYYHVIGPLRYAANAALIALMAADSGINPELYRTWAEKQIKYMIGANARNYSYQVGFGSNFPKVPSYMGVSCPDKCDSCDVEKIDYIGALVSGPDEYDNYAENLTDIATQTVEIDFNAGFQSSLAGLIDLQRLNRLPNATPVCLTP